MADTIYETYLENDHAEAHEAFRWPGYFVFHPWIAYPGDSWEFAATFRYSCGTHLRRDEGSLTGW